MPSSTWLKLPVINISHPVQLHRRREGLWAVALDRNRQSELREQAPQRTQLVRAPRRRPRLLQPPTPCSHREHARRVELWSPGSAVHKALEGLGEAPVSPQACTIFWHGDQRLSCAVRWPRDGTNASHGQLTLAVGSGVLAGKHAARCGGDGLWMRRHKAHRARRLGGRRSTGEHSSWLTGS